MHFKWPRKKENSLTFLDSLGLDLQSDEGKYLHTLATCGIGLKTGKRDGMMAMHYAASDGKAQVIDILLQGGADVTSIDARKRRPLHYATAAGHVDCVKMLLKKDAVGVNERDANGTTPLHEAVGNGHLEIFNLLLSGKEINVNIQDNYGRTPLLLAIDDQQREMIQRFVQEDDQNTNKDGNPYIRSMLGVLRLPATSGTDLKLKDQNKNTPLHIAARSDEPLLFNSWKQKLRAHNVHLDAINDKGDTALHIAARHGSHAIMSSIFAKDTISDEIKRHVTTTRNFDQETPLHLIAKLKEPLYITDLLQYRYKTPQDDLAKSGGAPVLTAAFEHNAWTTLQFLMYDEFKADHVAAAQEILRTLPQTLPGFNKYNWMWWAISESHEKFIKQLIEGCDWGDLGPLAFKVAYESQIEPVEDYWTLAHCVLLCNGNRSILEFLVRSGLDIYNFEGWGAIPRLNPLGSLDLSILATKYGHVDALEYLLTLANKHQLDDIIRESLDLVFRKEYDEQKRRSMVRILLQKPYLYPFVTKGLDLTTYFGAAIRYGWKDILEIMVQDHIWEANLLRREGWTKGRIPYPLAEACGECNPDMVAFLIEERPQRESIIDAKKYGWGGIVATVTEGNDKVLKPIETCNIVKMFLEHDFVIPVEAYFVPITKKGLEVHPTRVMDLAGEQLMDHISIIGLHEVQELLSKAIEERKPTPKA